MQEMDGLSSATKNREQRIVVIGATNRPYVSLALVEEENKLTLSIQDLDEAVLRRLPRRLLVDLPGQKEREAILRILLKNEKLADDVDLKKIAQQTDTYSGSDLKRKSCLPAIALSTMCSARLSGFRRSLRECCTCFTQRNRSSSMEVEKYLVDPLTSRRQPVHTNGAIIPSLSAYSADNGNRRD